MTCEICKRNGYTFCADRAGHGRDLVLAEDLDIGHWLRRNPILDDVVFVAHRESKQGLVLESKESISARTFRIRTPLPAIITPPIEVIHTKYRGVPLCQATPDQLPDAVLLAEMEEMAIYPRYPETTGLRKCDRCAAVSRGLQAKRE